MPLKKSRCFLASLYWLPKLHKQPYKTRFIANSSACTTTELPILLNSCLTAIKNHVIKYCTTVCEKNGKNLFWSIKNSGEILNKLKSRGFLASGLSTYDFSTLYTTLPHNLVTEVNFVIILLNAKNYLFSFSATVSSVDIYLNHTKRGKNWFNLSCIVFLWITLKLSCSILSSNQ